MKQNKSGVIRAHSQGVHGMTGTGQQLQIEKGK